MRGAAAIAALATAISTGAPCKDAAPPRWPDAFVSRVELLALIQTLSASLLASGSASLTLERWCGDHHMAAEPKLLARRLNHVEKPASEETRRRLGVGPAEPLGYRRVQLSCGGHVLSEADNWYVPGRLSAETNRLLETTETPFGKAIAGLRPFRRTIDMKIDWSPLPEGWELAPHQTPAASSGGALSIPHDLFEHRAVVYSSDQTPLSEVHETYTGELLDFEPNAAGQ
jgi:chorismate-pyruvate lyase